MTYVLFANVFLISLVSVNGPLMEEPEKGELTPDQKLAALLDEFLKVLSEDDKKKRKKLTAPYSRFAPPNATNCYFNVYGAFMNYCCSYFYQVGSTRKFKYLFHRVCEAGWLTEEKVISTVRETCESKPHLRAYLQSTRKYRSKETSEEKNEEKSEEMT